jgi:hypothetical protein
MAWKRVTQAFHKAGDHEWQSKYGIVHIHRPYTAGSGGSRYMVECMQRINKTGGYFYAKGGYFSEEGEAVSFAKKYMRQHPNG